MRRWDPLTDLLILQEKMNRLFQESLAPDRLEAALLGQAAWTPLADAHETPDGFVVEVELPGVDSEDLTIRVEGDRVVIKGERRPARQPRPERFHRMERSYGPFSRSFQLGLPVDADRMSAHFQDGLLRLELPKAHPATGRRGRGERTE